MTEVLTATDRPEGGLVPAGEEQMYAVRLGSGRPTIFLHGGGPGASGWTDFGVTVPYFADREVILLDLLQYGMSSKPLIDEPIWTYHACHIAMAMDALGVEAADFVCSSIGGSAALALAADYPERVHRVVLTGSEPLTTGPRVPPPGTEGIGFRALQSYYGDGGPSWSKSRSIMAELEWFDPTRIPDATVDLRYAQSIHPDLVALFESQAAWYQHPPEDLEEKMQVIQAPVLFLWGKYDPFASLEYALRLLRSVPNGDLYVMDKASHHPEEEYPEEYSMIVRAFLDLPRGPVGT